MERFSKIGEKKITKAIVEGFTKDLLESIESDVIIVGGGPSGLIAGRELARDGIKTLIIESNNYLGGGFWIGGYLMNILTVRAPSNKVLDELGIPNKEVEKGLFTANAPHACSKLIAAACDAGVKILNMTKFDDVVIRNDIIAGIVINWTPVSTLPRAISCLDPVAIESKIVIDASGHDAIVAQTLQKRGRLNIKGFGEMWVERSEDLLVEKTVEVYPGLIATGMAVSTIFGIPRMGPTFGGMLISGKKAAVVAKEKIKNQGIRKKLNKTSV